MAHQDGLLLEHEIMKAVTGLKPPPLPYLFDHFETDGLHGQHLCIVQPVLSTDISRFRCSAPLKRLGFPVIKIIIAQVLQALVTLHAACIIH
jgi:serine/threonine-protein kinase SRPK3